MITGTNYNYQQPPNHPKRAQSPAMLPYTIKMVKAFKPLLGNREKFNPGDIATPLTKR